MAKGTLFHITTDVTELGAYKASNFYEVLSELEADYVEDDSEENAEMGLEWLQECVKNFADISSVSNILSSAFMFTTPDKGTLDRKRQAYLKSWYDNLQNAVLSLTLEDYASDSMELYELRQMLDMGITDMVYFENAGTGPSLCTMAKFIRTIKPDTAYYVSCNTILIH